MSEEKNTTRNILIEVAGELFAQNGFAATSVKKIAEKSKQNIAAVNYHFGSKQNLFSETLKFVLDKLIPPLNKQNSHKSTPQTLEKELKKHISQRTSFLLSSNMPRWYGELIIRAVMGTPDEVRKIEVGMLSAEFNYLENLARTYNPLIKKELARRWAYSIVGQVFFYVLGREVILLTNQIPSYTEKFIKDVSAQISDTAICWLKSQNGAK